MKQEEIRNGLWLASNGGQPLARVVMFDDKGALLEDIYGERHWCTKYYLEIYRRIATPAELSAAGVRDEDRLIEQQDWRIGVELFALDDLARVSVVEVKVDGERIADATDTVVEAIVRTFNSFNRDVTNDPQCLKFYSVLLRDFVIAHRSRRAGGEGAKRLACGHVLVAGDVTTALGTFRFWQVEPKERIARWIWEKEQERFGRACVQDADPSERLITPADAPELLKQNFPIEKLPADVRQAVEALRRPTLPDGSKIEVGEMYVSSRGWLQRVLVRSVSGDTWQRDYFDPNCRRWASGLPVDDRGECPTPANNLARLAQTADIPPEVNINIVPERIREQVRQQRGAGALKWNGHVECKALFRRHKGIEQKLYGSKWVDEPHDDFDDLPDATASQIIAANVPEQDIPACQIEGVRAERGKQAKKETDWLNGVHYDLKLTVVSQNGAAADSILNELISTNYKTCVVNTVSYDNATWKNKDGKLKAVPVSPSSPSPESGACRCEAANTLRDLIEAYNERFNMNDSGFGFVEWATQLHRKFELARESLGVESLNAGTEAA